MSAINPTPRRYASASLRVSVWMLAIAGNSTRSTASPSRCGGPAISSYARP